MKRLLLMSALILLALCLIAGRCGPHEARAETTVRLTFAGDVTLGSEEAVRTKGYSLENFCFGGNRNVRAMESLVAVAELKFADDGMYLSQQITLYPAHISGMQPRSNYQPHLVTGKDAARVMRRVQADTRFALNPVDEATGAAVQETQRAN